ncbi:MAG: endonuclease/exonuclease/phosphatase family protein, partial [Anaerolineaceae bacterium]|nr:endonuclease/exonuclease/phosphatase family protein [Anaerolineaceae bacterium]
MKIATFNLRHHNDRWSERFPLVVEMLLQADADVVGLQEVSLKLGPKDQAEIIVEALNRQTSGAPYTVHFRETRGATKGQEGIALITRLPIAEAKGIDLPELWRVAVLVQVEVDGRPLCILNTHLHHEPQDDEAIRYPQAQRLVEWAHEQPFPCLITGDFNAEPESSTIQLVKQTFDSAHELRHGQEPDFTWPTPLVPDADSSEDGHMIDYIFC